MSYSILQRLVLIILKLACADPIQMIHNIPQPTFEQFLTDAISKDANVDLRKGESFVSLEQVSIVSAVHKEYA